MDAIHLNTKKQKNDQLSLFKNLQLYSELGWGRGGGAVVTGFWRLSADWEVHIAGFIFEPLVGTFCMLTPLTMKSVMGAIIIHFIKIGGTHDISLLPQNARAALNTIRSKTVS